MLISVQPLPVALFFLDLFFFFAVYGSVFALTTFFPYRMSSSVLHFVLCCLSTIPLAFSGDGLSVLGIAFGYVSICGLCIHTHVSLFITCLTVTCYSKVIDCTKVPQRNVGGNSGNGCL